MNIDSDYFEHIFLLNCIKKPSFYKMVKDDLDIKYFNTKEIKNLLSLVGKFYDEHNKVPTFSEIKLSLGSDKQKNNFKKFLTTIKDFDSIDYDILVKHTEKLFQEQAVYNTMLEVADKFREEDISNVEILDKFKKACNISFIDDYGHIYFENIDKHIEYLKTSQEKISTGFDFIDKKLGGGVLKNGRSLYVILGATNSGKSLWLGNIASNMTKQGYVIPLITLEMSEQIYAQRISSNLTGIDMDRLKHETDDLKSFVDNFNNKNPESEIIIKEFPPGKLTPERLDVYLEKILQMGYKLGPIIIDYITLMSSSRGDGMYERGKHLAEDLRALTYKYETPIITALQSNREGTNDKMPRLNNMSESMGIGHTADFIFAIWREEEDVETDTTRGSVIKNRFGENFGGCLFETEYSKMKIKQQNEIFEGETEEFENIEKTLEDLSDF